MKYSGALMVAVFSAVVSVSGWAQEAAADEARALFEKSIAHASTLEQVAFDAVVSYKVVTPQGTQEQTLNVEVLFGAGNTGRLRSFTPGDEAIMYADGTETYVHLVKKEQYLKLPTPTKDRRDLMALTGGGPMRVGVAWVGEYLVNFPEITSKLLAAEVLAKGAAEGESTLKLSYENYDIELVLGVEGTPLPKSVNIDFAKSIADQKAAVSELKVGIDFTKWNTQPEIPADAFGWRPPEGMAALEQQVPKRPGSDSPTLGQPAPDFKLATLDGSEVSLSDHKDKHIVVLDFFASWCGPCRTAMPVVHELTKGYAERGVKMYAVNLREPAEKINQFLASSKLEGMPVLMDRSGQVGMDYGAMSIPRMVIIGKDGTVQAIFSGFSQGLSQELAKNLDTLLEGKNLVEATKTS